MSLHLWRKLKMERNQNYPHYLTYTNRNGIPPSVLEQEFPLPDLGEGEVYYPHNEYLFRHFSSEQEMQLFGASQFCSFLNDTIEVEHGLVIPAVATLRRIHFKLPPEPMQDLFKTATDEGFHAEQSLAYLTKLEKHFNIHDFSATASPLFIQRLRQQRSALTELVEKQLITLVFGIVTETRISHELGQFAKNHELSPSIRRICETHAQDEVVHSSQFQALGNWLWNVLNDQSKEIVSSFYANATIARSLPDIDNIIASFSVATRRTLRDSRRIVLSEYNEDILLELMLRDATPTLKYLRHLGVEDYVSLELKINEEQRNLGFILKQMRK